MLTESEIFQKQISILEALANILKERIQEIEKIARSRVASKKSDAESQSVTDLFFIRSLKFYLDDLLSIIIFCTLLKERVDVDKKIYFFLLPNVRTLLDVYAKLIHLFENCKNTAEQAKTCIACELLVSKSLKSEQMYQEGLSLYGNFLKEVQPRFPAKLSDYSKKWVKNNNLNFFNNSELLTELNIKKYSNDVKSIFASKEMYNIYSQFSEYLHGNPFYYIEEGHNEKFWVIAYTVIITAYIVDLTDLMILKKIGRKDFSLVLSEINKNKKELAELWQKNRLSTSR